MPDRRDERPASAQRRPSRIVFLSEYRERTRTSPENQSTGSLRKLGHLRRAVDRWKANGALGLPPQPGEYHLNLGLLLATEIWCGRIRDGHRMPAEPGVILLEFPYKEGKDDG